MTKVDWIPLEKAKPTEAGNYFATIREHLAFQDGTTAHNDYTNWVYYNPKRDMWFELGNAIYGNYEVLAWIEDIEPYKREVGTE